MEWTNRIREAYRTTIGERGPETATSPASDAARPSIVS